MGNKSLERIQNAYTPPVQDFEHWYGIGGAWVMVSGDVPYPFTAAATPEVAWKHIKDAANAYRVLIDPTKHLEARFLAAKELRTAVERYIRPTPEGTNT